jgi:cobyrinic acid a,c-diamide synthase
VLGPRLVVAGTHSGVGKTTVATGLMAAFASRGLTVASAKVGPDFIDPGYHEVATGRRGRNLDVFMCGADAIPGLAARAGAGADVLVVEGVMGLFDGVGATAESSTAHVAELLDAPVVLVVDASSLSASVVALVHGYDDTMRRRTGRHIAGVVLNRVGSDTHETILRAALDDVEPLGPTVVGALRRDDALTWRDRHLGLVPVVEQPEAVRASVRHLGASVSAGLDLASLEHIACSATPRRVPARRAAREVARVPVAVVAGPAFSFAYPDNLERLTEAGAELVEFDPLEATGLPAGVRALYAGGGFPEVFAESLAANGALLDDVRRAVDDGLPTWAECGGMLWLCRSVDGHTLCGALPADATMGEHITVGYRTATVRADNPVASAGDLLRGHELHYSTVSPPGDALVLQGTIGEGKTDGWSSPSLLATYLHMHLGADPGPAERFLSTAAGADAETREDEHAPQRNDRGLPVV